MELVIAEITAAILRLRAGEPDAINGLYQVAYDELKRLAHSRIWAANQRDNFATESLLHESYLRLSSMSSIDLPDRKRFFAYASQVMRNIILDAVRESNADRRGNGLPDLTLQTELAELCPAANSVEAINDALSDLQKISPELATLVEMRFFGGLTEVEIAQTLAVSERTVRREWEKARAALLVLLED